MINQFRAIQSYQQAAIINSNRNYGQISTYQSRDNATGDRILESADGGVVRAILIGVNIPATTYTVVPQAFSTPGYLISK